MQSAGDPQCQQVIAIEAGLRGPGGAGKAEQLWETEGYDSRGSNVMHMLGYFSLVGLQRVHALIGDYHTALAVLHPIHPFHKAKLFAQKVPGTPCLGGFV